MKAWSVIGLVFTAAIIATIPISPQVTPPLGVELSVNQAQAITFGRYRRVSRRVYRGAYRSSYYRYYGAPGYYYDGGQPIGGGGGQRGASASRTLSICQKRTPIAVQLGSDCRIASRARKMANG